MDVAVALLKHLDAMVDVVGADDDIGLVALGKGIHVFDEDVLLGQVVQDVG